MAVGYACCTPVVYRRRRSAAREEIENVQVLDPFVHAYVELPHFFQGAFEIFRFEFFEQFDELLFRGAEQVQNVVVRLRRYHRRRHLALRLNVERSFETVPLPSSACIRLSDGAAYPRDAPRLISLGPSSWSSSPS